jgi:hypothetical protein
MKLDAKALWDIREGGLGLYLEMAQRIAPGENHEHLRHLILLHVAAQDQIKDVDRLLKTAAIEAGWVSMSDNSPPDDLD